VSSARTDITASVFIPQWSFSIVAKKRQSLARFWGQQEKHRGGYEGGGTLIRAPRRRTQPRGRQLEPSSSHLRRCGDPTRAQYVLFEDGVFGIGFDQRYVIAPEIGKMLKHPLGVRLVQLGAFHDGMA
jgi:hypothetical protein